MSNITEKNLALIKLSKNKEHLGTLTFIPWQDGGVIRMKGKIPLDAILVIVSRQRPMILPSDGYQYSMVLKVTRRDFENWVDVIEKQSDMKADLVVMGTHGRRGFQRLVLGSVAERFVRILVRKTKIGDIRGWNEPRHDARRRQEELQKPYHPGPPAPDWRLQ